MIQITLYTEKPFFADVKGTLKQYEKERNARIAGMLAQIAYTIKNGGPKKMNLVDKDSDDVIASVITDED